MRRISRIDRSIDLSRTRSVVQRTSPFVCTLCQRQSTAFSTSSPLRADKTPFTETIRKKIWGGDAPGLKDPYGDGSVFDRTKKQNRDQTLKGAEKDAREIISEITEQQPRQLRDDVKFSLPPKDFEDNHAIAYEPAKTWDGLKAVGGKENWYDENWNRKHPFNGFLPKQKVTDADETTAALHRAMVEVFALQQAGIPISKVAEAAVSQDYTYEVEITPSASGVSVQFPESFSLQDLLQTLSPEVDETKEKVAPTESEEDFAADRSTIDTMHTEYTPTTIDETSEKGNPTESEEDVAADRSEEDPLTGKTFNVDSWNPSWKEISLENPEVKFAVSSILYIITEVTNTTIQVLKRTLQLTGVRFPDSAIPSSNTAKTILNHLITPPKPRKLFDALKVKEDLLTLPNVSVYQSKITFKDKEETVGRWKVIEQELRARGLPLFGGDRKRKGDNPLL